jgi:hypothetical protein
MVRKSPLRNGSFGSKLPLKMQVFTISASGLDQRHKVAILNPTR